MPKRPRPARAALGLAALIGLAACQMTAPQSPEDFEAERIARTMAVVDACRASECGRLDLDSGDLPDYAITADMTHVTAYMASFTDFNSLAAIAQMGQLRELHIGASRVADLSGLSNFPNLTVLHAQDLGDVNDLAPIGQLRNLRELAVGGVDLADVSFVRGLPLIHLNLDYADIDSLSGLRGHPTLQTLDMVDAGVPDDLSPLLTIPNLRELTISTIGLSDDQMAVIDRLQARDVAVDLVAAVIVC